MQEIYESLLSAEKTIDELKDELRETIEACWTSQETFNDAEDKLMEEKEKAKEEIANLKMRIASLEKSKKEIIIYIDWFFL